jgi:hypothetical protein
MIHSCINRLLVIATMIAVAGSARTAHAQVDEEMEERPPANPREDLLKQRVEQQFQVLRGTYKARFESWVVAEFGARSQVSDQLEMQLETRVLELKGECHLTVAQVKKLQVAGRGDIKRFMDRFNDIARTIDNRESSKDDLRAAILETDQLQALVSQRLFGEDSILGKILGGTLDPHQVAEREKALLERNKLRYQTAVGKAVKTLQANLGLKKVQSAALQALLVRETHAPRRFGNAPDIALVLFQASRIPEEKIRSIVDKAQWSVLSRWMAVYIKGGSGEKMLKRNGFVFDDDPVIGSAERIKTVNQKDGPGVDRAGAPRWRGSLP